MVSNFHSKSPFPFPLSSTHVIPNNCTKTTDNPFPTPFPLHKFITHPHTPSPLNNSSSHFFFSAEFHRTLTIPTRSPQHFSASQSFFTQYHNEIIQQRIQTHDPLQTGLLQSLKMAAHLPSEAEAMASLDESGIRANQNLVCSMIWELREECRLAFLAFKWGDKWGCVDEKACELMVWVLGNHKKFNTAWILIRDLHRSLMSTRRAMLIMIDRYAAANVPGKAINAFRIMDKFRMTPDEEAFYFLLNILCKNGNIEEAEEFMLVNKKFFPLEVEGFNIILNGWCNICVDVYEAKRIWREMSKYCIDPDATSYTHMISCFSKVGNLFDSMRLYDGMKKRGWVPGIEVYNSLVYILTRENCFKQALKILDKMKETGLQPDSATYNSMIRPLCEAKKLEDARSLMAAMIEENVSPTIETYHAFLEGTVFEETFEVLDRMKIAGLGPTEDTFLLLLAKFFKLEQPDNALKIWVEMKQYEVAFNLTHYTVVVEGLARCGSLTKAREYHAEMRSNGYSDDPKLQKMLKVPVHDKNGKRKKLGGQIKRNQLVSHKKGSIVRRKSHQR